MHTQWDCNQLVCSWIKSVALYIFILYCYFMELNHFNYPLIHCMICCIFHFQSFIMFVIRKYLYLFSIVLHEITCNVYSPFPFCFRLWISWDEYLSQIDGGWSYTTVYILPLIASRLRFFFVLLNTCILIFLKGAPA